MGRALQEIGVRRAVRYVLMELAMVVHAALLLPPLRAFWLRLLGARIGRDTHLMGPRFINLDRRGLPGLRIGARCYIARGVCFDLADSVEVLDETSIGDDTLVLTHLNVGYRDHPLQRAFPAGSTPARLGPGAFIGAHTLILPGASVGRGAFVAAGSVVTAPVPDGVIVAGNPAREVGKVADREARAAAASPAPASP